MDRSPPDAGFALLEAIVSALVLAVVALAVLSGIDGASSSAARERSRSVASSLAEQDQERMRAMSAQQLAGWVQRPPDPRPVTVDGIAYTVQSRVGWIVDSSGGTVSCTNDSPSVSYLRISSTVTSAVVGQRTAPVELSSLVAPPPGPARGTLAVQVTDRDHLPIVDHDVTAIPDSGGTYTERTNELGCAVFTNIPVDTYTVNLTEDGYIDAFGQHPGSKGAEVLNGTVQVVTMRWDRAGATTWSVTTEDPFTTPRVPLVSTPPRPANGDPAVVSAVDGEEPTLQRKFTSSPAADLFPFATPYTFFTGGCRQSNPQVYEENSPLGSVPIERAPAIADVAIRQPPLGLRLKTATGYLESAAVTTLATLRSTDESNCTETYRLTTARRGSNVGYLSRSSGAYDPGLPFGTYDVCVKSEVNGNARWLLLSGVDLTQPAGVSLGDRTVDLTTRPSEAPCPT